MDSMSSWKHHGSSQSSKAAQMKEEGGNAALIPGSSAWGAMKGGTSQKPLPLTTADAAAPSSEKTSPKPSSAEKSWPPSCSAVHVNGIVTKWGSAGTSAVDSLPTDSSKYAPSGWGSPDSSPIPNAGTEVWTAQKQSSDAVPTASRWGSENFANLHWSSDSDQKNTADMEPTHFWGQKSGQQTIWGSAGDTGSSTTAGHWAGNEQGASWGTVDTVTSPPTQPSALSTWAQAAGRGLSAPPAATKAGGSSAPGSNASREELIVRAINSQDGWGRMPIRQDTAWHITNDTSVTNMAFKSSADQAAPQAQLPVNNTGTAIWQASKDSSSADLVPRALLAPSGREPIVGNLPWVVSEANVAAAAGWGMPLQVEGSALLPGERGLPLVIPRTNNANALNALLDAKDASMAGVNAWNIAAHGGDRVSDPGTSNASLAPGSVLSPDAGPTQHNALAALLDKYDRQSSANVWDNCAIPSDRGTDAPLIVPSPTWGGQALPPLHLPPTGLLSPPGQGSDLWGQGASRAASWGTGSQDNAIWSSTALGKMGDVGCGWGDSGWSATSHELKPVAAVAASSALSPAAAATAWNAHDDLTNTMLSAKKTPDTSVGDQLQGEAVPAVGGGAAGYYPVDSSSAAELQQKYRQLCAAAGSVPPSSGVNRVPPAASAAGTHAAMMAAAAASGVKSATSIVTPNIYKPPPALPVFPPPALQQSKSAPSISPQQAQQLIHAQMLQHLQSAGQAPPSLASAPPTPSLVIQLHHLVQLQQILQRLQLQQQASTYGTQRLQPRVPALRPDPLAVKVAKVRQQIIALHLQIKQTCRQQQLISMAAAASTGSATVPPPPPPPELSTSGFDLPHELVRDFSSVMRGDDPAASWKQSVLPDMAVPPASGDLSHSIPPAAAQSLENWPGWPASLLAAGSVVGETRLQDGNSDGQDIARAAAALDIEEFIPGKLWQGPTIRSADDDPFITPGGTSNSVSPGGTSTSTDDRARDSVMPPVQRSNNGWPGSADGPDLADRDPMSMAAGARAPPGLVPSGPWSHQPVAFCRSTSWAPQSSFGQRSACSVVVRNLPAQIDEMVVRGLCQQHGPLHHFQLHSSTRHAIATYSTPDEAVAAKLALNSCSLAGATLSAELIPDAREVSQLSSSAPAHHLAASLSSIWSAGLADPGPTDPGHHDSVWQSSAAVWSAASSGL